MMDFHSTDGFPETAIRLVSGKVFDYADPMSSDIEYHDVAHSLARMTRFAGHTANFYTVGNHELFVSFLVTFVYKQPEAALGALHHDDVEFVTMDWPSPLKRFIKSQGFDYKAKLERPIELALSSKLGVPLDDLHAGVIKDADRLAFVTEGIALKPGFNPADQGFDDIDKSLIEEAAKYLFLMLPNRVEETMQNVHQQLMNGANAELVFKSIGATAFADAIEEAKHQAEDGDSSEGGETQV